MNFRRGPAIAGVACVLLTWALWSLMDTVPDYSTAQNIYWFTGDALVVVAIVLFFNAFRVSRP